ncbi:MAG TPA: hypothetical protein VH643_22125 [Gemmataceae bacterium]|jgi:hypothetical protein
MIEQVIMSSTIRAYSRCNSGHYFLGEFCPYDGWSSPASRELMKAVARLAQVGKEPSIKELKEAGVSRETLWRTIVVSFGVGASMFDALSPDTYVVNGETKPPNKLGPGFR